ncbi:MAG: CARDB domain-containing protein, partial [Candidatus Bipolaricaulia bacterium]
MVRKTRAVVLMLLVGLVIGLAGSGEPGGLPELHLQKIVLDPPSPVNRGEEVAVRAWVMNTGERPAGEFKVEFFHRPQGGESWTSFHVVTVPNLAPSRQEALEIKDDRQAIMFDTAGLELGTYEIRVVADSNDQIPEGDETNNELVTTLTVLSSKLGMADLQPVALEIDPPSPTTGQLVVVSIQVENMGDKDAGPFRVAFFIDGQEFDAANLEGLAIGARALAQGALDPYALGLGPGSHQLLVRVDADDQIEEQDEANNELTATLTIQGAELHPTSLEFDKALVRLDERVTISSKVVNTGKGVAKTVEVGFYIDGTRFALAQLGPLGKGEATTAQGELVPGKPELNLAPITEGGESHDIRVVVDPNNLVPELDEANNELAKALRILPPEPKKAELHPESLELTPPSPVELGKTEAVTVSSVIKNTGKAKAEGFAVGFYHRPKGTRRWISFPCGARASESPRCTDLSLNPGREIKIEGAFSTIGKAPGIYEIRVVVYPPVIEEDELNDIDPTNNELTTSLTLLSPRLPDLTFDPLTPVVVAPSYQVNHGQTLRFTANLMNLGDLDAGRFE